MQSELNSQPDAAWNQLSPLLDEAMLRLGQSDRDALVLRYFEGRSLQEVGSALGAREDAAKKRVSRALEKLRNYFMKRGVTSTTAAIAGAISANSVHAAPAALAKTVTTVALAKGATAPISTLTLIKGALKIMAWTKAKTAIAAGIGVLLVAGTTTVTVKEIQEHKTYPWQVHEGTIEDAQLNQPPQVRILRSKFHIPDQASLDGKAVGTGVSAKTVVTSAYDFRSPARAIYSAELPGGTYDYIACLPGGGSVNAKALQAEVKRVFGVVGTTETRNTNVWLLKVKFPNALALKCDTKPYHGESFQAVPGGIRFVDKYMPGVTFALESYAGIPVIDETGLTNRFDFDLNCTPDDLKSRNLDYINLALGELGLELAPTNMPIEMLVVEKAPN